jgi:hypothetical protein
MYVYTDAPEYRQRRRGINHLFWDSGDGLLGARAARLRFANIFMSSVAAWEPSLPLTLTQFILNLERADAAFKGDSHVSNVALL